VVISDHQNAGQSCDMKDGLLKKFLGSDILMTLLHKNYFHKEIKSKLNFKFWECLLQFSAKYFILQFSPRKRRD